MARSPNDLARDIAATGADVRPGQERIRGRLVYGRAGVVSARQGGPRTARVPRQTGAVLTSVPRRRPGHWCFRSTNAGFRGWARVKDGPAVAQNLRLQDASPPRCTGDASSPFVSQTRSGGGGRASELSAVVHDPARLGGHARFGDLGAQPCLEIFVAHCGVDVPSLGLGNGKSAGSGTREPITGVPLASRRDCVPWAREAVPKPRLGG